MIKNNFVTFNVKNPRRNLPENIRFKRPEIIFQNSFLKTYLSGNEFHGIGGNQFEMPGYGIADFIWANPAGEIDAFEFKVSDWKKGVGQAARYRSYANRSFLVIPDQLVPRIQEHITFFQKINLGLWSFNKKNNTIVKHFTPCKTNPLNSKAQADAFAKISRKLKFRKLLESGQCHP